MPSKLFLSNWVARTKQIFQGALKIKNVGVKVGKTSEALELAQPVVRCQSLLPPSRLNNIWKKILPNIFFRSLARDHGHQAAWRRARNLPLLSFVGLIVAQRAEEKDDEIAGRILDLVKKVDCSSSTLLQRVQELSLDKFEFGQLIGQGCNAAVYEACLKPEVSTVVYESVTKRDSESHSDANIVGIEDSDSAPTSVIQDNDQSDTDSDITVLDHSNKEARRVLEFHADDDTDSEIVVLNLSDVELDDSEKAQLNCYDDGDRILDFDDESETDSDISVISWSDMEDEFDELVQLEDKEGVAEDVNLVPSDPSSSTALDADANTDVVDSVENGQMYNSLNSNNSEVWDKYNLAVKMMFNYGVESNAEAILREMENETVPARLAQSQGQMLVWQNGHKARKKSLPPHPNIVEMWGVFVDPVPHLPDSLLNYPAALPARINPNGIGRNMTMFLVMKKYHYTLGEYLSTFNPNFRERLTLLGQLLEAVAHMRRHGVAHRDLKLDNIFLDTTSGVVPQLVVGDFGCCLADDNYGMQIPYPTDHMDRGGNTALMAPEISTAEPGMFKRLDYRKADLWATAALAYEILGESNPFYTNQNRQRLDSRTYSMSELPPLPDNIPQPVKTLIYSMLNRDPNMRPTARFAADVIQVLLWVPSDWLLPSNSLSKPEVTWWLLSMATEVLLGSRSPERMLKQNFVQNFCMNNLKSVFAFLNIQM